MLGIVYTIQILFDPGVGSMVLNIPVLGNLRLSACFLSMGTVRNPMST